MLLKTFRDEEIDEGQSSLQSKYKESVGDNLLRIAWWKLSVLNVERDKKKPVSRKRKPADEGKKPKVRKLPLESVYGDDDESTAKKKSGKKEGVKGKKIPVDNDVSENEEEDGHENAALEEGEEAAVPESVTADACNETASEHAGKEYAFKKKLPKGESVEKNDGRSHDDVSDASETYEEDEEK